MGKAPRKGADGLCGMARQVGRRGGKRGAERGGCGSEAMA